MGARQDTGAHVLLFIERRQACLHLAHARDLPRDPSCDELQRGCSQPLLAGPWRRAVTRRAGKHAQLTGLHVTAACAPFVPVFPTTAHNTLP